ncbi:MAG: precorrin-8X methylmutase [Oscillatoriales cyanobacterium SM2_1_8]|nr:precorrin-8X methylmutase [Oscillatoriales cyanobacterium SM2_1_8]
MDGYKRELQQRAIVDRTLLDWTGAAAQREVLRQVLATTTDFAYKDSLQFSEDALSTGAAALAARTPIVTDTALIRVGLVDRLAETFGNPVYCATDAFARSPRAKAALGIEALASRYPQALFAIGESQASLAALLRLMASGEVKPPLVVAVPPNLTQLVAEEDDLSASLRRSEVPHILTRDHRGNPLVAIAVLQALLDLAWQAYGREI